MEAIKNKRPSTGFSLYDDEDDEQTSVPAKKPSTDNLMETVKSNVAGCSNGAPIKRSGALPMSSYFDVRQGERDDMQDTHILLNRFDLQNLSTSRSAVYGIFDGHGGIRASTHCEKVFADKLKNKLSSFSDLSSMERSLKKIFTDVYKEIDDSFLKEAREQKPVWKDGTTATTVLCLNNSIYVANIGDSKTIVCRAKSDGTLSAVPLTVDHNPTSYEERMRIQKSGGSVVNGRVNGVIEVSRSIGDGQFKNLGVISAPDMKKITITENDRFLLMACDGLWKAFSNEEAIKFVTDAINDFSKDDLAPSGTTVTQFRWQTAVSAITAEAVKRKCGDNVSAILVKLDVINV